MKLSDETIQYTRDCWGLDCCENCDYIAMLWSSGYYEETIYSLWDDGAFCKDGTPEEIFKEIKKFVSVTSKDNLQDAIDFCLSKDGDYTVFECSKCEHVHFINSLYYDDVKDWPCDGCAKTSELKKGA